jgi:hypothetical protein
MLSPDITIIHIIFISISLSAGIAAIYFWVRIYLETQKGSIAWLLLALTAVFLISTSIFQSVAISNPDPIVTETMFLFLGFWGAVYTSVFAGAGLMMFNAFRTIPREKLGDFLIEGMIFQNTPILKSACGKNCLQCEMHINDECEGCINKNKDADEKCPIYICVVEKGFTSCKDCDITEDCEKYDAEIKKCPLIEDIKELPQVEEVSSLFNRSTLLEYTPYSRYEDSVIEICLRLYGEMVNMVLVSTPPRTALYMEKLGDLIDVGAMKFVEISTNCDTVTEENGIIKLPISEIDKFFDLTSKLPENCAVIFEPITQLMATEGESKTYNFISRMVEEFNQKHLLLIGMINKIAHDEKDVAKMEGLFLNLAEVVKTHIRVLKGGKEEYVRFYVGDKFYMEQNEEEQ